MITIYHNPRCKKSREGLAILEDLDIKFNVRKYLDNPLNKEELKVIIDTLKIKPEALVRKNETIWKTNYKSKALSDNDLIEIMVNHPKLIERPIVINKNKGLVGRPPELIKKLF
ncbi:MAG: arsenate reductase (glutaredoxin) [Flavobacteriaceae bacterium]